MRVYKYELQKGRNEINFTNLHAYPISVMNQGNQLVMYAKTDEVISCARISKCRIHVHVVYTGEEYDLPNNNVFLGTVEINKLVYHVFWNVEGN